MHSIGRFETYQNCFRVSLDQKGSLQGGGGKRKIIKGLSKGARRKLVFLINSLGPVQDAFFVTLTMREASEDYKEWKKWLNRTLTGLRYHFPKLTGIWRLEFQKRGTPHYHLLLLANSHIDPKVLRSKIRQYWSSAVGKQNIGFMGSRVEKVRDIKKSGFYLAIYQAKDEQDRSDIPTGRLWGTINKADLPVARYEGGEVSSLTFNIWCKRIYRRYIKANGACTHSPLFYSLRSRDKGFTGFISRSSQRQFFALCSELAKETESRRNDIDGDCNWSTHNWMELHKEILLKSHKFKCIA